MINRLDEVSKSTGVYQLTYLLEQMLERKEIEVADIVARTNVILVGELKDENVVMLLYEGDTYAVY